MVAKKGNLAGDNGLAAEVASSLNKKFKNAALRITTGKDNDSVSKVSDWIATGSRLLDFAISNLPNGGYPCGRVTMLWGPEQSGKSLAAMHALADTQRRGGKAVYIDAERSIHRGFCEAIGINYEELYIMEGNELESVFSGIVFMVTDLREKFGKDVLITIVLDSLSALMMEDEDSSKFKKEGYKLDKAKAFSEAMPKIQNLVADNNICFIMTNQARVKLGAKKYENPWKGTGGQALPHYASVIIYMAKGKKIKATVNGLGRIVGRKCRAAIEKNRLGPPETTVVFDIYFDRGIDDLGSWFDYVKLWKLCKFSGSWISYTHNGDEFKEQSWGAFCNNVLFKNPEIKEAIWTGIYENFKTVYRTNSADVPIMYVEDDVDDEEDENVEDDD